MQPIGTMTTATSSFAAVEDAFAIPMPAGLRVAIRPDDVGKGLGKLVLTLVELIRQLLERQAIRRIEAGSLADDEIERLGTTFLQLGEQVTMLRQQFGLDEEDLNLDLGPLGKLL